MLCLKFVYVHNYYIQSINNIYYIGSKKFHTYWWTKYLLYYKSFQLRHFSNFKSSKNILAVGANSIAFSKLLLGNFSDYFK